MQHSDFEKETIKCIETHFTGGIAILGTGSFFNGKNNKNSDIDLIIFDSVVNSSYSEKIIIKNIAYEMIVIATSKISKILKEDLIFNSGVISSALRTSKVLKDTSSLAVEVIKYSEILRDRLYPTYDTKIIKNKSIILSNLIEDLETSTVFLETYFIVNEISNITLDLLFNAEKVFKGFGKNKSRILESIDSSLYTKFTKSIKLCLLENNKDLLIKNTKKILDKHQGYFKEHSYRDIKMNLNEDVEILFIKIPADLIKRAKIFVHLNTLKLSLTEMGYELNFYQLYNESIEVEIKGVRKTTINKLYLVICKAFNINPKDMEKIKITNLNFGTDNLVVFKKISNLVLTNSSFNSVSEVERLKVMYAVFCLIIKNESLSVDKNIMFSQYLTEKWGASSYDINLRLDYKSLLDYKKNREEELLIFRNKLNIEDIMLSEASKLLVYEFSNILHENIELDIDNVTHFEIKMLPKEIATKKTIALEKFISKTLLIFNFENRKALLPITLESI